VMSEALEQRITNRGDHTLPGVRCQARAGAPDHESGHARWQAYARVI
jgi:hypothetical protein